MILVHICNTCVAYRSLQKHAFILAEIVYTFRIDSQGKRTMRLQKRTTACKLPSVSQSKFGIRICRNRCRFGITMVGRWVSRRMQLWLSLSKSGRLPQVRKNGPELLSFYTITAAASPRFVWDSLITQSNETNS